MSDAAQQELLVKFSESSQTKRFASVFTDVESSSILEYKILYFGRHVRFERIILPYTKIHDVASRKTVI
jgi:hypothetical protein